MTPKLELISTRRCPFVQRSIITLLHKGVPHEVSFVDLAAPPEWFKAVSPFGKVPVLRVDDRTVLFESAVINEYLDEITPGSLLPDDPVARALCRSWIAFGGECLTDTFKLLTAADEDAFEEVQDDLREHLERLEGVVDPRGPYFGGESFSLVDTAYAPLFVRLGIVEELTGVSMLDGLERMTAWSRVLCALPAVQQAQAPELRDLLRALMVDSGGHAGTLLASGPS